MLVIDYVKSYKVTNVLGHLFQLRFVLKIYLICKKVVVRSKYITKD